MSQERLVEILAMGWTDRRSFSAPPHPNRFWGLPRILANE